MDSLGAPSNFLVQCFQLLIQPDGQFLGGLLYANVLYHEDANACHGLDYMRTSHGGQAVSDTHTHTCSMHGGLLYANILYDEDANACHGSDYVRTCENHEFPY